MIKDLSWKSVVLHTKTTDMRDIIYELTKSVQSTKPNPLSELRDQGNAQEASERCDRDVFDLLYDYKKGTFK